MTTSKYRDLNAAPKQQMADIVATLSSTARQPATGAFGRKAMGTFGDLTWRRSPDGREISVREVDSALIEAQGRIDQAESALEATGKRLDDAEALVEGVRDELDGIDWDAVGAEVYTEGPPPANPTIGKALWVSPLGRVFRAVECEEHA